jgi:hypothetical protein
LYICFTTVFAQKLPTAFTGVVQVEKVAKKGEESETVSLTQLSCLYVILRPLIRLYYKAALINTNAVKCYVLWDNASIFNQI